MSGLPQVRLQLAPLLPPLAAHHARLAVPLGLPASRQATCHLVGFSSVAAARRPSSRTPLMCVAPRPRVACCSSQRRAGSSPWSGRWMRRRTTYPPMTCRQAALAPSAMPSMFAHSSCRPMPIEHTHRRTHYKLASCDCSLVLSWLAAALQVEEGTPFARRYSAGEAPLPSDDAAAAMYCTASTVLGAAGRWQATVAAACCDLLPAHRSCRGRNHRPPPYHTWPPPLPGPCPLDPPKCCRV